MFCSIYLLIHILRSIISCISVQNELVERRIILTNLLQDIFSQQQERQKQLFDQLREVEKFQSSVVLYYIYIN